MSKGFLADYAACILFRTVGFIIRLLPKGFTLFWGRRLGDLLFYCDRRHRYRVYAHIKTAFGSHLSPEEIKKLVARFYRSFGQSMLELFFVPLVNKEYLEKYVTFEGMEHIDAAFKKGKGVVLLAMHAGSWELTSVLLANLGFPSVYFARNQRKYPRLEKLLNAYRVQKGCRLIQREEGARGLIRALANNEVLGMTVDQGGKTGTLVKFFGKNASMPTGAVKFALKFGATILPSFYVRSRGPHIKIFINPALELVRTGDPDEEARINLERLMPVYEKLISRYPQEFFWIYKVWKYSDERNILIISDGKTGHLRQSQAAARALVESLRQKGMKVDTQTVQVNFRSRLSQLNLLIQCIFSGKYSFQGSLKELRNAVDEETFSSLVHKKFDIIISCGSSVAPVNYMLARENMAKSVALLKPSILSFRRFDLVVMPRHDHPPSRKNLIITEGALNLIDDEYLAKQSRQLISGGYKIERTPGAPVIGLLLGGDTKEFSLTQEKVGEVIGEIKKAAELLKSQVLVTTSRRTSRVVEELVKKEFREYPLTKLLIIANEKNIPEAVGGILGLADVVITSPESISMVSEAVASKKHVFVFKEKALGKKHSNFLRNFALRKHIDLVEAGELSGKIKSAWIRKRARAPLEDYQVLKEGLKKIL